MIKEHTPGPWGITESKINSFDGRFSVLQQKYIDNPILNAETIESKFFWFTKESGYNYNHPRSRALANAKLVSAAPDLLEALEKLTAWVVALNDWSGGTELDPPVELAKAAIFKANI